MVLSIRRLDIAMPVYDATAKVPVVGCLVSLTKALTREGVDVEWRAHSGATVDWARNVLTHNFLHHSDASHLLFIDADMAFDAPDIVKMLSYDLDVLAAVYVRKELDWANVLQIARARPQISPDELALAAARYAAFSAPPGPLSLEEPFEVNAIGTGIMLIKRTTLERVRAAHPERTVRSGAEAGMHIFFRFEFDPDTGFFHGEDSWFCDQVRQAGGKIYGAAWGRTGHMGNHLFLGDPSLTAAIGGRL
jgi:hypothetical protein